MQVTAPAAAFAVTFLAVWLLTSKPLARLALDRPNERSLHQTLTPRLGGLGIHAGVWVGWALSGGVAAVIVGASVVLVLVSVVDDMRGLPVLVRLSAHLIAAAAVCAGIAGAGDAAGWALTGLLVLALAWMANAYNFMDGADGLAGGMAASGFFFYGMAAQDTAFATANFCIAAAACAFLCFNFAPAKIFMGDAGSVPLGFLAASLGLAGWAAQQWPWWFPLVVFAPFIADASLTLLRRAVSGARLSQAHREHSYQRLVRMGWSHRRLALAAYALMALCGTAALLAKSSQPGIQLGLVAAVAAAHIALVWGVDRAWNARQAGGAELP